MNDRPTGWSPLSCFLGVILLALVWVMLVWLGAWLLQLLSDAYTTNQPP